MKWTQGRACFQLARHLEVSAVHGLRCWPGTPELDHWAARLDIRLFCGARECKLACMATVPLSEILKLSVAERIQLAEDIWDSIAAEPEALPLTPVQRDELRRRSTAYRQNPDRAVPLDAALERIEQSLGSPRRPERVGLIVRPAATGASISCDVLLKGTVPEPLCHTCGMARPMDCPDGCARALHPSSTDPDTHPPMDRRTGSSLTCSC